MIDFFGIIAPLLPTWLPLALAIVAASLWLALAISRPYTISSRYENAMLAVAFAQGAVFYLEILRADLGIVPLNLAVMVVASRWFISWLYLILILNAVWAWRRSKDEHKRK